MWPGQNIWISNCIISVFSVGNTHVRCFSNIWHVFLFLALCTFYSFIQFLICFFWSCLWAWHQGSWKVQCVSKFFSSVDVCLALAVYQTVVYERNLPKNTIYHISLLSFMQNPICLKVDPKHFQSIFWCYIQRLCTHGILYAF